jgi:hypothetical protein
VARIVWSAAVLAGVFALVYWQAGGFAAAVSVVVALAVTIAFRARGYG